MRGRLGVDQETPEHTLVARSEPIFIPIPVLSEAVWLLLRTVEVDRAAIVSTLDTLIGGSEIVLDQGGTAGPARSVEMRCVITPMDAGASA